MSQRRSTGLFSSIMFRRTLGRLAIAGLAAGGLVLGASPAEAGRGGSPQKVASAISSGSADAIKAELERSEYLVCAACVPYVVPLIDSSDAGVRKVAAWWLVRRGSGRQVYRDMLQRLGQPDSVKARNAADVLGEFSNPAAIPALGAALSNPVFDGEARVAMAHALGAIRRPAAAAPLRAVLGDAQAPVRAAALSAIRKVEGFRDGSVAVPLLADADAAVRVQAIYTVAHARTLAATPELVRVLQSDADVTVRKGAAWALGDMQASSAVAGPALSQAASSDASPLVRSLARAAISNLSR
ncbi:MAG: HEAT repeat domain-containing protein [Pseudomonadota bacterium]